VDLQGLVRAIITLLLAAGLIGLVCYIVVRVLRRFFSAEGDWPWIVYCIGGLLWILVAIRVLDINVTLW
jgi:hypothetical protein